jgi:hypothetical protein
MKKVIKLVVILIALLPSLSFAQTQNAVWAEMKAFHNYMSSSFHPAEEGNFAPLRTNADNMFLAAKAWKESTIPETFKPEETKAALRKLVSKCAEVKKAVEAKLPDAKLLTLISEAHDVFHTIVGECKKTD